MNDRLRILPAVLVGAYCWSVTLLPAVIHQDATPGVRVAALVPLGLLLLIPVLRAPFDLFIGADGFLLSSALSWWLASRHGVEVPISGFGVLGWVAFPLAWGALSTPDDSDEVEEETSGPPLQPRTPPNRLALGLALAAIVALPLLLLFGPSRERPEAFILGEMALLVVALLSLRATARLTSFLQTRTGEAEFSLRSVLVRIWKPAAVLVLLLGGGVYWLFF